MGNHPDKLMARGVPKEFVAIATEKVSAINEVRSPRNGGFSRLCTAYNTLGGFK